MQIRVLGTSSRASLVSSNAPCTTPPGSGTDRRWNVSSCSADSPSRFSFSASSDGDGMGSSCFAASASGSATPGPVSTYTIAATCSGAGR